MIADLIIEEPRVFVPHFGKICWRSLTHIALRSICQSACDNSTNTVNQLRLAHSLSHLKFLALHEYNAQFTKVIAHRASVLKAIETLVVSAPADPGERVNLGRILHRMPRSLAMLNISAQPFTTELAQYVVDRFEQDYVALSELRNLRLPRDTGLILHEGEAMAEARRQLERVAEVAGGQGVRVERVQTGNRGSRWAILQHRAISARAADWL